MRLLKYGEMDTSVDTYMYNIFVFTIHHIYEVIKNVLHPTMDSYLQLQRSEFEITML